MLSFVCGGNLQYAEMEMARLAQGKSPFSSDLVHKTLSKIRKLEKNEMSVYVECFMEDHRVVLSTTPSLSLSGSQIDALFQVITESVLNKREMFAEFLEAVLIIKDKPKGHEMRRMGWLYDVNRNKLNVDDKLVRRENRQVLHPTTLKLFKLSDRLVRLYPGLEKGTEDETFNQAASGLGMGAMKVYFFFAGYQDGPSTVRQLEARKQSKTQERRQVGGVGVSCQPQSPLFTLEEVDSLSVRQLKEFLVSRGINLQAFLEKAEMAERAKAELAVPIEPAQPPKSRAPPNHHQ
uniref:Uncharacterized protein n=1 Tax=Heterosigma akashiwo TaxID=2829 RepID=A0A7S3XSZ5_HETAK